MARGDGLLKATAIRILRDSDGDLTNENLARLGLWHEEAVVLGQLLEHMDCAGRTGPRRRRVLTVPVEEAVTRLEELPDDFLMRPAPDADRVYTVVSDPHNVFAEGEILTVVFLGDLVESGSALVDGLEVESRGVVFRVYQGVIYHLVDGEMVPKR